VIRALIVGDVWLSSSLKGTGERLSEIFEAITGPEKLDILVANLEAPLGGASKRLGRRAILKTEANLLPALRIAQQNILTLANNHICDYGAEGLLKTLKFGSESGFRLVGAGRSFGEATTPLILESKERKVAIFALSEMSQDVGSVAATREIPGIAPLSIEMAVPLIKDVRDEVDDVWIFLHWGREFIRYPSPQQKKVAKILAESGASLIVGHHPHVIAGSERIGKTVVYYSMGNFIFPDVALEDGSVLKWNRISRRSIALLITLKEGTWCTRPIYLKINRKGIPERTADQSKSEKRFRKLSDRLSGVNYTQKYLYYSSIDYITRRFFQLLNIRKFPKDIAWAVKCICRGSETQRT